MDSYQPIQVKDRIECDFCVVGGGMAGVIAAIAAARGPIENAWLRQVAIVRGSMTEPRIATVNYNAVVKGQAPDIPLQPRDIVYVPFKPHRSLEAYANIVIDTFVRTVAANEGGRAASRFFNGLLFTQVKSSHLINFH